MKIVDFREFRKVLLDEAFVVNDQKGKDYGADADALANFKALGERLGMKPVQVWAGYAFKHFSAIETLVKKGELKSEAPRSRFVDAINYLILGAALLEDRA
jgi:hypothetical protein